MPMKRQEKTKVCRVPWCDNTLGNHNHSGVCRRHNHAKGYCRCGACVQQETDPKICRVPDCGKPLRPDNTSGVCARHMHVKGYCWCLACGQQEPPKGRAARPDLRCVSMRDRGSATSSTEVFVRITLPQPPWETRNDNDWSGEIAS